MKIKKILDTLALLVALNSPDYVKVSDLSGLIKGRSPSYVYKMLKSLVNQELVLKRNVDVIRAGDPSTEYTLSEKGKNVLKEIREKLSEIK